MKKDQRVSFLEIEGDSDFFEKMGKIIEKNNETMMVVKRLSRREAYEILSNKKFKEKIQDITDTEEEESKIVYPKMNSQDGKEKVLKISRLAKYIKTRPDIDDETSDELFVDKKTNTYYKPETAYFKVKTKNSKYDGPRYIYYSAVFLHDITKYVKEEMKLLEDATTGVPSKKQLMPMLLDYISQALIKQESFALTMLDIDHFKNINDTYGHQFGDGVLKALAQFVNRSIRHDEKRENDIMSRYGGEEFVFTLNNINFENAQKTNERIRKGIQKTLRDYDNIEIDLTCSMGMVHVDYEQIKHIKPTEKKKIRALANKIIKIADEYMYKSKNSGRNKVTVVKYYMEKDIEDK